MMCPLDFPVAWEEMEDLAMEVPRMLELAIVPRQVRWTWTKRIVSYILYRHGYIGHGMHEMGEVSIVWNLSCLILFLIHCMQSHKASPRIVCQS